MARTASRSRAKKLGAAKKILRSVGSAKRKATKANAGRRRAVDYLTGQYVCTKCDPHRLVKTRNRTEHDNEHFRNRTAGAPQPEKLKNVVAEAERKREADRKRAESRRKSATVQQEVERRRATGQPTTQARRRPTPAPVPPGHQSWNDQRNQRRKIMAGNGQPETGAQRRAASGPVAQGLLQAGRGLAEAMPEDHTEMRELMLSVDAGLEIFAECVEAFQAAQVARGFSPVAMAPLDQSIHSLMEGRYGYTRVLLAIERIYAANFEAAQNAGPGESFFGAPARQQGQRSA